MKAPTLTGSRVKLRAVRASDLPARRALGWHASIERNYGHQTPDGPMSDAEARAWFEAERAFQQDEARVHWTVEVDGQLAGATFLHGISEIDRKARFAIGMFHPRFVGRGLGREATGLVLEHAFRSMRLHRVDLRVLTFNERAIAAYRRCGFVEEGRERESCWLEGRWHDDLIMGVLAQDVDLHPASTAAGPALSS